MIVSIVLYPNTAPAKRCPKRAAVLRPAGLLERQNQLINRYHLERIRDLKRLKEMIAAGQLVPVPATAAYYPDYAHTGELDPVNAALYAHARPWLKDFLDQAITPVSQEVDERFKITSLVRTKAYQRQLARVNPAAASGRNPLRQSPHLTGSTVDISTRYMSEAAKQALRRRLKALARPGAVVYLEEIYGGCFHIFVLPDWQKRIRRDVGN